VSPTLDKYASWDMSYYIEDIQYFLGDGCDGQLYQHVKNIYPASFCYNVKKDVCIEGIFAKNYNEDDTSVIYSCDVVPSVASVQAGKPTFHRLPSEKYLRKRFFNGDECKETKFFYEEVVDYELMEHRGRYTCADGSLSFKNETGYVTQYFSSSEESWCEGNPDDELFVPFQKLGACQRDPFYSYIVDVIDGNRKCIDVQLDLEQI
jgi:hypothetical protein